MWHVWWWQPVYACEAVCPVLVAQTFYTDMHMGRRTRPQHICLEKASPIWTRLLLSHNLLVKSSRPAPDAVVSWEIKPVIVDRCAFSLHFYDIPHTMVLQEDSHDSVKWIHWRSRTFLIIRYHFTINHFNALLLLQHFWNLVEKLRWILDSRHSNGVQLTPTYLSHTRYLTHTCVSFIPAV